MAWLAIVVVVFLIVAGVAGAVGGGGYEAGRQIGYVYGGFMLLLGAVVASLLSGLEVIKPPNKWLARIVWGLAILTSLGSCVRMVQSAADSANTRAPPAPAPVADAAPPATAAPVPVSAAQVEAKLSLECTDEALCACVKARFSSAMPAEKLKSASAETVDTAIGVAREECELRDAKARAGAINTCVDEKKSARGAVDVCACAADAFLTRASTDTMRELRKSGWTNESVQLLAEMTRECEAKAKAEAAKRKPKPKR